MRDLDPITLSVIQAGLQQVCDEMDLTFSRAAFSPVIAEANDRSDGIYDATVTDQNGTTLRNTISFDTFGDDNFTFEAEDWNHFSKQVDMA